MLVRQEVQEQLEPQDKMDQQVSLGLPVPQVITDQPGPQEQRVMLAQQVSLGLPVPQVTTDQPGPQE